MIYEMPEEKYTTDEFLEIFKQRRDKLCGEYKNLTVEEARIEFEKLYDDCPISIIIDPFGLISQLKNYFPNFFNSTNSKHI